MKKSVSGNIRGFTLIEMAVVLVASGLVVAGGFSAYTSYLKRQNVHLAYDNQDIMSTNISNYFNLRHRLPCPSDPSLPLTDPNAGIELPDVAPANLCTNLMQQPDGTCWRFDGTVAAPGTGICKTTGRDTAIDIETVLGEPVLIGGVPYITLKSGIGFQAGATFVSGNDSTLPSPPDKDCVALVDLLPVVGLRENASPNEALPIDAGSSTYCDYDNNGVIDTDVALRRNTANFDQASLKTILDPYGYQMTYAVTGALTNQTTFHDTYGAIFVQTERIPGPLPDKPTSLVQPEGSAQYVILSHGDNHLGAFNPQGQIPFPCGGPTKDVENCDGDGIFMEGLRSVNMLDAASQAAYFDDTARHYAVSVSSLWAFVGDSLNMYNLNVGNVGVGTLTPSQKLEIVGDLRADTSSMVHVCDGDGAFCWNPDNLAGDPADNGPDGALGSLCDTATLAAGRVRVVVGIKNGKVKCSMDPSDLGYDPAYLDPLRVNPTLGLSCPAGQFVKGFNADGTPACCDLSLPTSNPLSCSYTPP